MNASEWIFTLFSIFMILMLVAIPTVGIMFVTKIVHKTAQVLFNFKIPSFRK